MPLPKRRHSNQRTRKRRTHYKLTLPELAKTRCGCPTPQYRLAHHACPVCGFYNGKLAVVVKVKTKAEEA